MAPKDEIVALKANLTKKRRYIKTRITVFKKYMDSVDSDSLSETDLINIRTRISKIETAFQEYETFQEEACELLIEDEEVLEQDLEEHCVVSEVYYELIASTKHVLSPYDGDASSQSSVDNAQNISSSSRRSAHSTKSNTNVVVNTRQQFEIKLPTIDLVKFHGNYENWLEFRDTFKSLIHANGSLSDMARFHYLRASLTGDAAQIIKSLELVEENYAPAWDLLCSRYDNSSLLVHNHLKALFEFESIKRESSERIRNLVDTIKKHTGALSLLGLPTESWDTIIIYVMMGKVDSITLREWESKKKLEKLPTLEEFINFLKGRANVLETLELTQSSQSNQRERPNVRHASNRVRSMKTMIVKCTYCQGSHFTTQCESLLNMSVEERISSVNKTKLCNNCLRYGHFARNCRSTYVCKTCKGKHHTMLHLDNSAPSTSGVQQQQEKQISAADKTNIVCMHCTVTVPQANTVLPTAIVHILDKNNREHPVRILLDSASQANFISKELLLRLKLDTTTLNVRISDFNNGSSSVASRCEITLKSLTSAFTLRTSCFVTTNLDHITTPSIDINNLNIPSNLRLADPQFNQTNRADILIGSECFWDLLCVGFHFLGPANPRMQKTRFGWIVAGPSYESTFSNKIICNSVSIGNEVEQSDTEVRDQLDRFWVLEECSMEQHSMQSETEYCENYFRKTHKREDSGRFIVSIPFKDAVIEIGDSYEMAKKRFLSLENRLIKDPSLYAEYAAFIHEYLKLEHMSLDNEQTQNSYFLPHHAVKNDDSTTTKLRVVFDGSARASCGKSINEFQYAGPTIQSDLISILLKFRTHPYVVTADIEKMYRQVLVEPQQRRFQKILWRDNFKERLKCYKLNTVTYGTVAASFLSIRCLHEIANSIQNENEKVAHLIKTCFYVDDLIIGFNEPDTAIRYCNEISNALKQGCFNLRKFMSNDIYIYESLNESDPNVTYNFGNTNHKALGLIWSPKLDILTYKISSNPAHERVTKRNILSRIASIFDPLGLIAPVVITAKILLQRIWKEKLEWDESLPNNLNNEWFKFSTKLNDLNDIQIKRYTSLAKMERESIYLHGFCDASKHAYGACIYLVTKSKSGKISSNILCAKTRVTPIKEQTIPRLELCGALLLSKLYEIVRNSIEFQFKPILWCDSTIVLCWLKGDPRTMKSFIGNRVTKIQNLTHGVTWSHITSENNPADLLSRGINVKDIANNHFWWHGPQWLQNLEDKWPINELNNITQTSVENVDTDLIRIQTFSVTVPVDVFHIDAFSSLRRLKRVVAYCYRFINNLRQGKTKREFGPLSAEEIESSFVSLIKLEQQRTFINEMECFSKGREIDPKSKLLSLSPFLDDGLMRVGGRLRKSLLPYTVKHPIVLSNKSHLTTLIFRETHSRLFHVGPMSLLHSVRQRFWPLRGRDLAKQIVHNCIICKRAKPLINQQKMGDLPFHRVTQSFPFQHTGVDFAGPFTLKSLKGRGGKLYKAYVSLFVCLSTRAIHLEIVNDLSAEAFMACLRRFSSRRGKPSYIYSDNGTNFIGAKRILSEISNFIHKNKTALADAAVDDDIRWKFIPASAPNFGGLWEAGVKSVKFHLKRVILDRTLTYEEFHTVLTQVEAILNSRPISPMSLDPNDESPLTPAHLLIGRNITTIPDMHVVDIPESRLDRYQRTQALVQGFWRRWHHDYLNQLQQRLKWKSHGRRQLQVGDLVTINEPSAPPMKWKMGRVVELHPGNDSITRVVTVKTTKGTLKRPVNKLGLLLSSNDDINSTTM